MSNVAVVLSSENSHYIAWQTFAFCVSSIKYLKVSPVVIVHATHEPIHKAFSYIKQLGCIVRYAESYRAHPLGDYPPRNELGSLLVAAELCFERYDYILFCESDLLFTRPLSFEAGVTGQHYGYMRYDEPRLQALVTEYAPRLGPDGLNAHYQVGVPYVLPVAILKELSQSWIECLEQFPDLTQIDIMYAFGLCLAKMDIVPHTLHNLVGNDRPDEQQRLKIIHYCYGDRRFDKRSYSTGQLPFDEARAVMREFPPGSIGREIASQLSFAGSLYNSAWKRCFFHLTHLLYRSRIEVRKAITS